jgi:anthranilate synthase component 2
MVLLIDNFDSFSYILADYFRQLGKELFVARNDIPLDELKVHHWEALILSPGPGVPSAAGNLMDILDYYAGKIPVLGICLGHQAIGEYFGASLEKGRFPVHGKVHQVFKRKSHEILQNLPEVFSVTRYHSLILKNLPDDLEGILETQSGELMAFVHKTLPIMGIQYHPEAHLTEFGLEIIKGWMEFSLQKAVMS